MKNKVLIVLPLILFVLSCIKKDCCESSFPLASVYKIKDTAYFNYVRALLKKDGNQIGAFNSTPGVYCKPLLIDGFYYESNYRGTCEFATFAEKTIILNVRNSSNQLFNADTMMNHILDRDPFSEFYQADYYFIKGCKSLQEDTAKLNEWIRKGELGQHLKRLK